MTQVYVSVGSNQQASHYVPKAVNLLKGKFPAFEMSPVYESEAVGFEGGNFINLVVGFETDLSLPDLASFLDQLEQDCGRTRKEGRFSSRTMDLDLLTYGDLSRHDEDYDIPRDEILRYAFVLKPLMELVPDAVHPELNERYVDLWQQGDFSNQALWKVDLEGRAVNLDASNSERFDKSAQD